MIGDLTTLADVSAYLQAGGVTIASGNDAAVRRLISSASRAIMGYLSRPSLLVQQYTEIRDGNDQPSMMLRQWPVLSVLSVAINGTSIPAALLQTQHYGWRLESWEGIPPGRPQLVHFLAGQFWRGQQNVAFAYTAGYSWQDVVTAETSVAASALSHTFAGGVSVAYANGALLTQVVASPAAGQYVAPTDVDGNYVFNSADAGAALTVTYSYTPADIEQACIELVSERLSYAQRAGVLSRAAGDTKEVYAPIQMSEAAKELLGPYRNVVPV